MKKKKPDANDTAQVELNLKRAVIDMLVLQLLHERDMYVKEIVDELECQSGGMFKLVCPYNIPESVKLKRKPFSISSFLCS